MLERGTRGTPFEIDFPVTKKMNPDRADLYKAVGSIMTDAGDNIRVAHVDFTLRTGIDKIVVGLPEDPAERDRLEEVVNRASVIEAELQGKYPDDRERREEALRRLERELRENKSKESFSPPTGGSEHAMEVVDDSVVSDIVAIYHR